MEHKCPIDMSGTGKDSADKLAVKLEQKDTQVFNNQYSPLEQTFTKDDGSSQQSSNVKVTCDSEHGRQESAEFVSDKQPVNLFTGTFSEESGNPEHLEAAHQDADVYLASSDQPFLHKPMPGKENKKQNREETDIDSNPIPISSNVTGVIVQDAHCKQGMNDAEGLHLQTHAMSISQDTPSTEAPSVVAHIQGIDQQGQMYSQQPTYVLLQTGGDHETGGQPQVFLAMQTGGVTSTDTQAYITLHPVSVEGQDLSGAFTGEGLSLQNAILTQTSLSTDVSMDVNQHASIGDIKSLQLGQAIDSNSQMFVPATGQLVTAADGTDLSGSGVITYIQPVNSLTGGQTQVLMAVTEEDDAHSAVDQLRTKKVSNANNVVNDSSSQTQKTSNNIVSQSRRRLSNDPRTCEECGRTFKYPSDLKKHLQIHTDLKKFQCEDCCRCFRRLHQLNVHKRIHSGEKPYVCNRCGAEFRHDSTLTMHIRTRHDHLKPFLCDGCGKNFGRMSHLRKHQRNVCGKGTPRGNIFSCKYCEETFSRKTDLRQHFLSCEKKPEKADKDILGPTMFVCEHCGKEFVRNYDFKRHQLSHTDEKPFACTHCAKNFKERSSLYKHVKRMHALLTNEGLLETSQDDTIENEAAQQAIATITTSEDRMPSTHSNDIIVSLSHDINTSSADHDTIATPHTFEHAGIIENADQILHGSHTIAAADILNFPEVAAALGLNSTNANTTEAMVVEHNVDAPNIIAMEASHVPMQDGEIPRALEGGHGLDMADNQEMKQQFNTSTIPLHLSPDSLIIDASSNPVIEGEQNQVDHNVDGNNRMVAVVQNNNETISLVNGSNTVIADEDEVAGGNNEHHNVLKTFQDASECSADEKAVAVRDEQFQRVGGVSSTIDDGSSNDLFSTRDDNVAAVKNSLVQ